MYLCMPGPHRVNVGGRAVWALQAAYLLGWMKDRTPCIRGQTNSALASPAGVHQFTALWQITGVSGTEGAGR